MSQNLIKKFRDTFFSEGPSQPGLKVYCHKKIELQNRLFITNQNLQPISSTILGKKSSFMYKIFRFSNTAMMTRKSNFVKNNFKNLYFHTKYDTSTLKQHGLPVCRKR